MNQPQLTEWTPGQIDEQLAELDGQRYPLALERFQLAGAIQRGGVGEVLARNRAERLEKVEARLAELAAQAAPLNAEFARRGRWSRFYLVAGGHVHSSTSCQSCGPKTRMAWLPELSGRTLDDMVERFGDTACAFCFPSVVNHPAFIASAKLRAAQEAAEAELVCPGSGGAPSSRRGYDRGVCPACGTLQRVNDLNRMIRKHRKPEPKAPK